jgi:hypothetical protein
MELVDSLADEIATLSSHLDAATQRLLTCIRAFDEAGGWEKQGAVSCAHWLSWRVGLDLGTAREKVRVARALGALSEIDAAFSRGELSYAKVRALTRVASATNETQLLEFARHATGAQLERICRGYRQVARSLMEEGALPEERSVRERVLPGGMVKIEMVLHPDEAALVMEAIKTAQDGLREQSATTGDNGAGGRAATRTGSPERAEDAGAPVSAEAPRVSLADASVHLAQSYLAVDTTASGHRGESRPQIFVHLDQDVLAGEGTWAATLDDGTRLPAEALRRLACDAGLVPTRTDATGTLLDVGRRTRRIPPAIRRALWLRDRGCRFPGCGHTRFVHGHHIRHWLAGGPTSLNNLVLLCSRHHRLLHEGGWSIDRPEAGDTLVLNTAAGTRIPALPPTETVEAAQESLLVWAAERGLNIGPDTSLPWWDGATPDYDLAISSLLPPA